jgi:hypothetical protein
VSLTRRRREGLASLLLSRQAASFLRRPLMSCCRPLAFPALTTATRRLHAAAQCIHKINALGESVPPRRVAPLGWLMFVELPAEEAYAPLYAALKRLGFVWLAALCIAVAARGSRRQHGLTRCCDPTHRLRRGSNPYVRD